MKFSVAFLTTLAATAAIASPAPVAEPEMEVANLETRATDLVDFWFGRSFTGIKKTGNAAPEACVNFPNAFNNKMSSAKARPGWRCTIWNDKNCNGNGFSFLAHGRKKFPGWIDNKSSSWKCVRA